MPRLKPTPPHIGSRYPYVSCTDHLMWALFFAQVPKPNVSSSMYADESALTQANGCIRLGHRSRTDNLKAVLTKHLSGKWNVALPGNSNVLKPPYYSLACKSALWVPTQCVKEMGLSWGQIPPKSLARCYSRSLLRRAPLVVWQPGKRDLVRH
jgi:hypothetical protein